MYWTVDPCLLGLHGDVLNSCLWAHSSFLMAIGGEMRTPRGSIRSGGRYSREMRRLFLPRAEVSIFTVGRWERVPALSSWRLFGADGPRGVLGRVCLLERLVGPNGGEMRTPLNPFPFRLDGSEMRTP